MAVKFDKYSGKKLVDATRRVMSMPLSPLAALDLVGSAFEDVQTYLAVITGSALMSGYEARWQYAHNPVRFTDETATQSIARDVDLRSGTTSSGYAINIRELAHIAEPGAGVAWYVWGVDAHHDDYPDGFVPQPVGGGGETAAHRVDQVVMMHIERDVDGNVIKWFDAMGTHDGACDA